MIYTYVLRSKKDNKWYTGTSGDLRKRFKQHNANMAPSTKNRGPFELIYYEACLSQQDAFAREKYLKTGMGKRYLKNRLKRFLFLTGLTILLFFTAFVQPIYAAAFTAGMAKRDAPGPFAAAPMVQGDANNTYSLTDDVWLNAQSLNLGKHLLYCH